ncbi:MAG: DnaJ C-terminal domain-containing protein, partial [Longimicrobiales bacterium]|nr:DnaJ C-terminal domain-containing protein [Longimicrobiales bacterium]
GLGDIFSSIFDRGGRAESARSGPGRAGRARGADVEYVVEISFEKAVLGGKVTINVPITEACATCGGSGAAPGTELRVCGECGGSGTVSFGQQGFAVNRPCPACFGRGRVPEAPCASCAGRGEVRQERRIAVTVPRGTVDGEKLRLTGQGERSTSGGAAGDLLLTFRVKSDPFFRRDGADIHVRVPINIVQAALGSKVKVRTVHGKRVVLTIPPGTQAGTRFRVRGQGIEKGGRRGDQIVEVDVQVPEKLSDEERAAMESFAEAAKLRH